MKRGVGSLACLVLLLVFRAFGQPVGLSQAESRQDQGETLSAADSFRTSAKAALQQGDLDGAEKYFRQSLSISEKLMPGGLAVARSLNGLGDVARQRGKTHEAEAFYQQALAIVQKLDPSSAEAANSLDGLSRVVGGGDFAKSEEYTLQAFSIRQKLDPNSLELALSLSRMAGVYARHGQWGQAEESYKRALSIQEKLAPESLDLAETLSNLGTFLYRRHRYDEACSHHRRALTIRENLVPDSLAVADSLLWLATCKRDRLDEEERYCRAALTIQEKLAPGSVYVARSLGLLSSVARDRGDLTSGEAYERQALAIWEKLAPGSQQAAAVMAGLSDLLLQRGDWTQAEEWAGKALEASRKTNPESLFVAGALRLLGDVAYSRGDLARADDYYHQALAISEKVDPGGSMSARVMRGLGYTAEVRGDLAKAEEYSRRALAIWEKTDPNGKTFAQGLLAVGTVLQYRGDVAQAEEFYRRALATFDRVVPGTLYVAEVLARLGELERDQGDLARAEDYQRRAVAIELKSAPGGPDLIRGLSDLGNILLDRGELSEALERHQQALAIGEKLEPGNRYYATSLAAVASIMRRQGKADAAAQYYQQALEVMETRAARLSIGDEQRASFRAMYAGFYKNYIDLLVEQKRFDLAFQVLERFRAKTLLETLAVAYADIRKGADPALLQQKRELEQFLAAKTQRRIQLLLARNGDAELAALDKEIQDLHSQSEELNDRIRASSPGYAALMHPLPISAKEAREKLLDEDTVLLEYSLGEERSFVWVLRPDSIATYELAKRSDIEQTAREIYRFMTTRDEAHIQESAGQRQSRLERDQQAYQDKVAILSRMVLEPIAKEIESKKRLLIVSDGALQYIPFAALPTPEANSKEKQSVPLLMTHEIVNLPSASALAALRQEEARRQPAPKAVAVLADPVFASNDQRVKPNATPVGSLATASHANKGNDQNKDAVLTEPSSLSAGLLTRSAGDVGLSRSGALSLPRLPFSRREADAIMAVTPRGQGLKAVDFDASRERAIGSELSQYRIVHFATHGLMDSQHPELSGLVLSLVDKQGHAQDGFLQLQDIYNLNLAADLVVLSACETGLGKEVNGEGLIGLTRGFMYAGATRVVSSLWKVDDFATAKLMKAFYTSMERDGKRPAEALREAQLSMLNDRRWSAPYYWAGFTIQGEWK